MKVVTIMSVNDPHKKTFLFWTLVVVIFFIIFLLWLPNFVESLKTLSDSIHEQQQISSPATQEWKAHVDELKKTFDEFLQKTKTVTENAAKDEEAKQAPTPSTPSTNTVKGGSAQAPGLPTFATDTNKGAQPTVPPAQAQCTKAGGFHQNRNGFGGLTYGVCIFSDGSECEEGAFLRNECHIGQYKVAEDGMGKLSDLVVTASQSGPCRITHGSIEWISDGSAPLLCADAVKIVNQGWGDAQQSFLRINNQFFPAPRIPAQGTYEVLGPVSISLTTKNTKLTIEADAKKQINESNEHNNILIIPVQ